MPVEIRELVIRANVEDESQRSGRDASRARSREQLELLNEFRELKRMIEEKNER